jgi:hypothetical protein
LDPYFRQLKNHTIDFMKLKLSLSLTAALAVAAFTGQAATPPAQDLLPSDTLVMATLPDWDAFQEKNGKSAASGLIGDPAMRPFIEKFSSAWQKNVVAPIERELGVNLDDYAELIHGQITFAVVQNGWDGGEDREPAALFILDSKNSSKQLAKALGELKTKWTNSGKKLKTQDVRGVEFVEYEFKGAELEKAFKRMFPMLAGGDPDGGEAPTFTINVAQSGSLLLIGNEPQAFEKLLVRQSGGSVPSLGRLPAFERDHNALFRSSDAYGWLHAKKFIDILIDELKSNAADTSANPLLPIPPPDKIMEALGLTGIRTMAIHLEQQSEGEYGGFFLGIPEQDRRGLFEIMLADAKDSGPLPFIPADAANFSRWRLDGKKAWAEFESLLTGLSPQIGMSLNFILGSVGKDKDPNFDIKQALFANLGDDMIQWGKPPRSADPSDIAQPPSVALISSPNPAEMANALKMLAAISPLGGGAMKEREFLGRTIYSLGLPSAPAADGSFQEIALQFAATGNYVAISMDSAMLEEYLRGASVSSPLRSKPGLAAAAEHVGGMSTGMFYYDNSTESMKLIFDMLRNNPEMFEEIISSSFAGMPGIEFWDVERRKEWVDFSLLPTFEQVKKYFGYSVMSVGGSASGIEIKAFTPTPPGLR